MTVDSRSPFGIKETYLLNKESTRHVLQMKASLEKNDSIKVHRVCRSFSEGGTASAVALAKVEVTRYIAQLERPHIQTQHRKHTEEPLATQYPIPNAQYLIPNTKYQIPTSYPPP